jgi:hypothetical protein
MSEDRESSGFDLGKGFDYGEATGGLEIGPYASHYQELFADALEDGVITAEERERLDKAADNLGINPMQINRLEQAMIGAYELHNRVKVIERWESEPQSLQPIDARAAGDQGREMLLAQIERLNARITELEEELREARTHVNVEVDLSGLETSPLEETPEQLRVRIRRDPNNPKLHAALYSVCKASGDGDGTYCAAQALAVLGAATPEHRALVDKYKRTGLIVPKRSLRQSDWQDDLSHPELEVVTSNIMSLIAPAALMGRVVALRREKKLLTLPEDKRQDLEKTTVMAARALGWSAAVLGMPSPAVWVDPERSVGYAPVPALPPFTLVGKQVLSGRNQLENAFLAARHMTYYRAEFFVKVLFGAVTELEDLFLAALLIGSPGLPLATHLKARVTPLSEALAPMLEAPQVDVLRQQFRTFVADGGRTNLLRWSEGVDKTACRAGLLLCDDLATASKVLEEEEGKRGPLMTDLLAFVGGGRYANLRKQLGITIRG